LLLVTLAIKNMMRQYIQFCWMIIGMVLWVSCVQEEGKKEVENAVKQQSKIANDTLIVENVDTLFATNAPFRMTRKIRKDNKGNFVMAAFEDIIRYDSTSFSTLPKADGFESFEAFDALEDAKGNIWIASTNYGVFCYNGKDFKHFTTNEGLVHNRTMELFEDRTGNIWIGTMGGVSCYNGKSFRNFTTKTGLSHNDVNTITQDKTGKIWFGTRGLPCIYDSSTTKFTPIINKSDTPLANVWSIIEDRKGNIWIGSQNGLFRYDGNVYTKLTTAFINGIHEDNKGNIWTISPTGILSYYDGYSLLNGELVLVEVFRDNNMFFRVIEDKMGNIWVGTLRGVFRYDGKNIHFFRKK